MSTMLGSLGTGTTMIEDKGGGNQATSRARIRRRALGGALRLLRTHRTWSVKQAADAAAIAPMTWRRLEEGLEVRERTHVALDALLALPPGGVRRALGDDVLMVDLVGGLGVVVTEDVEPEAAGTFLAAMVDRLATGSPPVRPSVRVEGMTELELATQLVQRLRAGPPLTETTEALIRATLQAMPDLFGRDQAGTGT